MANHTDLGIYGEELVVSMLGKVGIKATRSKPADIIIEGTLPIEVKTATLSKYNGKSFGYQFCVDRDGHTSLKGVAIILICVDTTGNTSFFIIPASEVGKRRKLTIGRNPEKYNGLWASYLNRWEVITTA